MIARNAAGAFFAGELACGGGAFDPAVVGSGNAAGVLLSGNGSVKAALGNYAVVDSGNAAGVETVTLGRNVAGDGEVLHHAALLEDAKESGGAVASGDVQRNAVALAVKHAAEGGNGGKVRALQTDVCGQLHLLILGPGIQHAVFRQCQQILCRGDGDDLPLGLGLFLGFFLLGFLCQSRHGEAQEQTGCQQDCNFTFHPSSLLSSSPGCVCR